MFLGFQLFEESFTSPDSFTKNLKKPIVFLKIYGLRAFLESFKSQDSPTKNIPHDLNCDTELEH